MMMQDVMIAGTVKIAAFPALIQAFRVPTNMQALMLLETIPHEKVESDKRLDLLYFALFQSNFAFARYRSGRVFHEYGEIRWEELASDQFQVIYTGDPAYQPALEDPEERVFDGKVCAQVSRHAFLFGKRLDEHQLVRIGSAAQEGDFAEVRIPRLLRYPRLPALNGAERVRLSLYEYVNRAMGTALAYRFSGLEPFQSREERTPA